MKTAGGVRGWGIVMEVETGKILGWASSPSFDLNKRDMKNYIDLPAGYLYEPGSVMKGLHILRPLTVGSIRIIKPLIPVCFISQNRRMEKFIEQIVEH